MDVRVFESLLYEDESETLDFKRDQYGFSRATDEQRAELLKDIVGFANAWRRADAYLLIGVEHVRGGRSTVVGVGEHLADHSLQQFINGAIDRPLQFGYEAFTYQGKNVGIVRISRQRRPFQLTRSLGKLRKGVVYVRRGSSTDPTKPATVDEIAHMKAADLSITEQATLSVEFAHVDRDEPQGASVHLDAIVFEMPDLADIPDLGEEAEDSGPFGLSFRDPLRRTNHDYYRKFADFTAICGILRPVRVVVRNIGPVAATDVRIELRVPVSAGLAVLDELPEKPESINYGIPAIARAVALRRQPGDVDVTKDSHHFKVDIDCGNLQPGRPVWSDVFYVGTAQDEPIIISGQAYSHSLSQPLDIALTVTASVSRRTVTVEDLIVDADHAPD